MPSDFNGLFARLRSVLQKHAEGLSVNEDAAGWYSLEGKPGPATLKAWRGKVKRSTIPVAWVQVNKNYVSYHLMGVCDNPTLRDAMSRELQARMQGKACFNFDAVDEALFAELDPLTARSIAAFRNAGFVAR